MSSPPSGRRRGEGGDFGVVLLQDGGAEDGAPGPRDELLSLAFLRTQAGSCRGPPARGVRPASLLPQSLGRGAV